MSYTIVTAADSGFFDLLRDLVASIRSFPKGRDVPVGCIDVGLDEAQRTWLGARGVHCVAGRWDLHVPNRAELPRHMQAYTARPFLPAYFPGFDLYLWIDADAWVQRWEAVELYLRGALTGALAATAHVDRSYVIPQAAMEWRHAHYRNAYGAAFAEAMAPYPQINSGVLCLPAQSPVWALWAEAFRTAISAHEESGFFVDQVALNYAVYANKTRVQFLPATCNWLVFLGTPGWDARSGTLIEPFLPYLPIGIVHLAGKAKTEPVTLRSSDGKHRRAVLRRADVLALAGMSDEGG